jgi:hypothetical protein
MLKTNQSLSWIFLWTGRAERISLKVERYLQPRIVTSFRDVFTDFWKLFFGCCPSKGDLKFMGLLFLITSQATWVQQMIIFLQTCVKTGKGTIGLLKVYVYLYCTYSRQICFLPSQEIMILPHSLLNQVYSASVAPCLKLVIISFLSMDYLLNDWLS